jgi:hypothetical protein
MAQGATVLVNFQYTTDFSGVFTAGGLTIRNADIFLGAGGPGSPDYTYAISLGDQGANGGIAAGFYSVLSYRSSADIWSARPDTVYGGAYGLSAADTPGQPGYTAWAAPTVLTAGNLLSGVTIGETPLGHGQYLLDAQIALTDAQAAQFAGGMDVFWGTGDCGNGSFLAQISDLPLPEPCSLAVLSSGVFYMLVKRRTGPQRPRRHWRAWLARHVPRQVWS